MANVWQIAAGDSTRYYGDLFLKHDVMFMGPGRHGKYRDKSDKYDQLRNGLRRFVEDVQPGHVVLLRCGRRAKAIGLVVGGYEWLEMFDDVFGWDLQHSRRVKWLGDGLNGAQPNEGFFARQKQAKTFSAVNDPQVRKLIEPLIERCQQQTRKLEWLPEVSKPFELADLGRELFARGVSNDAVKKTLDAIERQQGLWKWYDEHGRATGRPTEHEVVAHMVLPLLLALGWSEQLLAVEWKRIDLAGFCGTPTDESNCVLACEAKARGHGLQGEDVFAQAKKHGQELPRCEKLLLTNGARFYLYERVGDEWPKEPKPVGYLNVNLIRTRHLVPPGTNAVETIVALTPGGVVRPLRKAS